MRIEVKAAVYPRMDRFLSVVFPAIRARNERKRALVRHGLAAIERPSEFHVTADSTFEEGCRIGARTVVDRSSLGRYSYIDADSRVHLAEIGNFCSIANRVSIGPPNHPTHTRTSSHPAFYLNRPEWGYSFVQDDNHMEYRPTVIGNDVWIGVGATILGGLCVGDGCIVGAGSVVTRDLEPFSIAVGAPARILRARFSERQVAAIKKVAWWNRDEAWLSNNSDLMHNVDALVRFAEADGD